MNLSAILLAAAMSAAPAFAAQWAPEVNTENIAAVEIPAPAVPSRAGPRDGQNYSGAEELLIKEFGITGITVEITESEVIRQDRVYSNTFCFEHAFRQALANFLEDYTNPSSALSNTLKSMGTIGTPSKSDLKKARQKLLDAMNNPASRIALVSPYRLYQPLNGEKVETNWVFYLRLGDKPYWAIVDRSGNKDVYNYGAN
ncbi:MAG: hypothetical protein Q7R35_16090 [Elusimicrobiota bacterium]|nr:hypothetical protein [Elusimicrobiota bacterium]